MRKALLFLILLIASLSLYAVDVVFESFFPNDIESAIRSSVEKNATGRGEIEVRFRDYIHSESEYPGKRYVSFNMDIDNRVTKIEALSDNSKSLIAEIEKQIRAALYYDSSLIAEDSLRLEYIYKENYSFQSDNRYREGSTFKLVDTLGKNRGLFEISGRYDDSYTLRPYYLKNALPGISLRRASDWRWAVSFSSDIFFRNFIGTIEIGNTSWIYPFVPKAAFAVYYKNGGTFFYGGIGLEASVSLVTLFHTSFTLIEDGRIGATAYLLLGYGGTRRGYFSYGGLFSVYYAHSPIANLEWRLGYSMLPTDQGTINAIYLGLGGTF